MDRSYKCAHCPLAFNNLSYLNRHIENNHKRHNSQELTTPSASPTRLSNKSNTNSIANSPTTPTNTMNPTTLTTMPMTLKHRYQLLHRQATLNDKVNNSNSNDQQPSSGQKQQQQSPSLVAGSATSNSITNHCEFCKFTFTTKHQYEKHMRIHTSLTDTKCTHCDKIFDNLIALNEHRLTHKTSFNSKQTESQPAPPTTTPPTTTTHSNKSAPLPPIQFHPATITSSTNKSNLICGICNSVLNDEFEFREHYQDHNRNNHFNIINQGANKNPICIICKESINSENELQTHIKHHFKYHRTPVKPQHQQQQSQQSQQSQLVIATSNNDVYITTADFSSSSSIADETIQCTFCPRVMRPNHEEIFYEHNKITCQKYPLCKTCLNKTLLTAPAPITASTLTARLTNRSGGGEALNDYYSPVSKDRLPTTQGQHQSGQQQIVNTPQHQLQQRLHQHQHQQRQHQSSQELANHPHPQTPSAELRCDKCNVKFETWSGLKLHYETHKKYDDKQQHQQVSASSNTATRSSNDNKNKQNQPSQQSSQQDQQQPPQQKQQQQQQQQKVYMCLKCQNTYDSEAEIREHVQVHLNEANNGGKNEEICELCNSVFCTPAQLQHHLLSKHEFPNGVFSCPVCEELFVKAEALFSHAVGHGMTANVYKCTQCDQSFVFKTQLLNHEYSHKAHKRTTATNTTANNSITTTNSTSSNNNNNNNSSTSVVPQMTPLRQHPPPLTPINPIPIQPYHQHHQQPPQLQQQRSYNAPIDKIKMEKMVPEDVYDMYDSSYGYSNNNQQSIKPSSSSSSSSTSARLYDNSNNDVVLEHSASSRSLNHQTDHEDTDERRSGSDDSLVISRKRSIAAVESIRTPIIAADASYHYPTTSTNINRILAQTFMAGGSGSSSLTPSKKMNLYNNHKHNETSEFKCVLCDHVCNSMASLQEHITNIHLPEDKKDNNNSNNGNNNNNNNNNNDSDVLDSPSNSTNTSSEAQNSIANSLTSDMILNEDLNSNQSIIQINGKYRKNSKVVPYSHISSKSTRGSGGIGGNSSSTGGGGGGGGDSANNRSINDDGKSSSKTSILSGFKIVKKYFYTCHKCNLDFNSLKVYQAHLQSHKSSGRD